MSWRSPVIFRIASTNAQFSLPEIKLGVIPAYGGTQRLAREIGSGRALEMMLTGRSLCAEEALKFGLVNLVVPDGRIAGTKPKRWRAKLPDSLHSRSAPALKAVIRGAELPLAEGLELESKLFAGLFETDDVREGTPAFLEKRSPVFKGK